MANINLVLLYLGPFKLQRLKTWPLSLGSLYLLGDLGLRMGEEEEQGTLEKEPWFGPAKHLCSNEGDLDCLGLRSFLGQGMFSAKTRKDLHRPG